MIAALQESAKHLDTLMREELEADISEILAQDPSEVLGIPGGDFASALDPGFHAQALGIATEMVSDAALAAAGAETVVDKRLGMGESTSRNFVAHCISHLSFHSIWFRNAIRGAAGLALAVAVVEVTNVSHGFWVVLGTLSVLRSNALGTGATALRAIGGTAVGFLIGSAIMIGVSDHWVLLWFLLPFAVLVSGAAPAMISFAAGQAGFTVVVMILFNIIQPTGWKVGLTRIEDVAIGCAVSVVVGVLFWPRGATAALGRALSAAFVANSGYLADAVDRLTMTTRQVDTEPGQRESHSTYLLLDDAFRQFFAERGAKPVSVETVSQLFTGANRIRLAAYTLARLPTMPPADGLDEMESVAVAGAVLRDSYASSHRWYQEFAELLAQRRDALDPPPDHDRVLHDVLRTALEEARSARRLDRLRVTLQMFWADQLLETQGQVQSDLRGFGRPVRETAGRARLRREVRSIELGWALLLEGADAFGIVPSRIDVVAELVDPLRVLGGEGDRAHHGGGLELVGANGLARPATHPTGQLVGRFFEHGLGYQAVEDADAEGALGRDEVCRHQELVHHVER